MNERAAKITARWDSESEIWFATSDDIPGLAVTAKDKASLKENLQDIAPDLMQANLGSITFDYAEIDFMERIEWER